VLAALGVRLRAARLRRGISAAILAARAGMSLMTLRAVERGKPGATMGAYLAVLQALGLEKSLDHVAEDDQVGRGMQDAARKRAPRARRTGRNIIVGVSERANAKDRVTATVTPAPERFAPEGNVPTVRITPAPRRETSRGPRSDDLLKLITGKK
jgi:transcriptional regulator with XRE-family HTH domain